MEEKKKNRGAVAKKTISIVLDVIAGLFAVFSIFVIAVSASMNNGQEEVANIFATQLRLNNSDTMESNEYTDVSSYKIKSIPNESCVFIEAVPTAETEKKAWYSSIKVGDVLAFKYVYYANGSSSPRQLLTIHRVIKIEAKGEGDFIFTLEGDNRSSSDIRAGQQTIDTSEDGSSWDYIIGKVKGQSHLLGLTITALKEPSGIILIVIAPCLIIIIYEAYRIFSVVKEEKSEKIETEKQKQNEEIAALKKELESLKSADKEETPKKE